MRALPLALAALLAAGCTTASAQPTPARGRPATSQPAAAPCKKPIAAEWPEGEARHLRNLRALTSEGRNGEAYFSRDGKRIIFQSIRGASPYYQMYVMNADGSGQKMISSGRGKCTCGFFAPNGKKLIYASTQADPHAFDPAKDQAPPAPPRGHGSYAWDFDPAMDVFEADLDGRHARRLTTTPGYDAEDAFSPDGKRIVFTSQRDGDLELYVMNADGSQPRRLTRSPGYDGGAFFAPDGRDIVFRSFRGDGRTAEIFLIGADGANERQLTKLGVVSWAPYWVPDGKRIIFASNPEGSRNFELYLMKRDGSGLERITYTDGFDGLPSFSADGTRLLWTSSRGGGQPQVYVADWVD
jgi:Tol biopolymer transport system component